MTPGHADRMRAVLAQQLFGQAFEEEQFFMGRVRRQREANPLAPGRRAGGASRSDSFAVASCHVAGSCRFSAVLTSGFTIRSSPSIQ